jgi:hypothetical protein
MSGSTVASGSSVTFASVVPTVTGEESDGDTVYVTSDGTATGVMLSEHRFVADASVWIELPNGAQWSVSSW